MATEATTPAPVSAEDKIRYDTLRKELIEQLSRKRASERQLAQLEFQLYNFEHSYLTDTLAHSGGNVILGFDAYHKQGAASRKKHEISDQDRMFSNSSLSYQKSLELIGDGDDPNGMDTDINFPGTSGTVPTTAGSILLSLAPSTAATSSFPMRGGSRGPTPGLTTVVLPPAQSMSVRSFDSSSTSLSAAAQKKQRDKEYQRRKRANQRAAISAPTDIDDGDSSSYTANGGTTSRRTMKKLRTADD